MSIIDVSLSLPIEHPRKDALEEQMQQLLIHTPKKTLFGQRIFSVKRQRNLAVMAKRISQTGKRCVISVSQHRQKRYFANSVIKNDTLELKRGIERHEALRSSKQEESLKKINGEKKTFNERKKKLDQMQTCLKSGYDTAVVAFRASKKLDGLKVTRNRKFKKVLKKGVVADSMAVELTYWSGIGAKCCQMDLEAEKLSQLRRELIKLDKEIESLEINAQREEKELIRFRNERAEILAHIGEQSVKVQEIEKDLTIGTLNTLTIEGSECAESIQKIIKEGMHACISVKSMVTGFGLVGSLLTFASSLDTIVSNGNSVIKMENDSRAIQSFLESPTGRNDLSSVLINNMYSLKLNHLNRSIRILREEARSAAATLISSTLSAGKFSVALAALAASTVLAAPGLNITAFTLAALTSVGLKGLKLFNALKHDREGVKLDVQIAEESALILTSSGEFYANAIEFDAIRSEIDSIMLLEADIKGSIQLMRTCKSVFKGESEAKEFYELIEDEIQKELLPVSQKKLEYQVKYELLQGELYRISLQLDQITVYKRRLQDDRSMEALALEFTSTIKKGDIVSQYKLFKEILKNETTKLDFINFLSREDIPVVSEDLIFESILAFIRNDKQMPRSLRYTHRE